MNSFIVVGVFYWTAVEWKELLPDSSLSHLDYESRSYDIGLCGTSMSGICCIIAEQYWEAWGLFWKRSVSLCFLGVLFWFWVFRLFVLWFADYCLSFLVRGNRQSKQDVLTVWASSAYGTGKKKNHSASCWMNYFWSHNPEVDTKGINKTVVCEQPCQERGTHIIGTPLVLMRLGQSPI